MDFLARIETLPPVEALKSSFYVYPLVNALHILAFAVTVSAVLMMDLRLLGIGKGVAREPFSAFMHAVVTIAFPLAVATGLTLFSIRASEYAANPAFLVKLGLLVLAGLNLVAHRRLARHRGAGALAAISILLWVSIVVAGRFIGFV